MRQPKGFTLIEMLLVITLISAITIALFAFYKQKMLSMKISQTALQMQQWLQAGQLFYIDYHRWPEETDRTALLADYLPVKSEYNAWGQFFEITESGSSNRFRVKTTLPQLTQQQQGGDSVIANRLAALLPNAGVMDFTIVYAEVLIPGQVISELGKKTLIDIVERDLIEDETVTAIPKPTDEQCNPKTHQAKIYLSLTHYDFNSVNNNPEGWLLNDLRLNYTEDKLAWYPHFVAEVYRRVAVSHRAHVVGIILCEPNTDAVQSTPTNSLSYYF